jgi:aminopeptidase N
MEEAVEAHRRGLMRTLSAIIGWLLLGGPCVAAVTTQLPRNVRPLHYDVALTPDPAALTFRGQVAIALEVLNATKSITLNANGLAFTRVGLSGTLEDEAGFGTPRVALDAGAQTATFSFERTVPPGRYQLVLEYDGTIQTRAFGLFALDYETPAGPRRALFTQFESADARRVIPGWDEPAYKATFSIVTTVPDGQSAVSNMPLAGTEDLGGGRTRMRFAQTPPMSTYLVFLAIGEFDRATASVGGAEIGVVTRRGMLPQAAFALDSSQAIVREYEDYFALPYMLPKLDNVAAPGSSQMFGAMENWGAILSFEYALLLDPTISTEADRRYVFGTTAHEIAHQWFGNLVTMQWWDDLWLNESFAEWMEGRTTARLHPEWNAELQAVGARDRAMERDALATTHPIVQHVETVDQMDQAFDEITYEKGAAVVRMLEGFVGSDAWRDGVRRYLKAHAYGNTSSADFWRALEDASDQPVAAVARDFTMQPGVPLIRVEEAACASGATKLKLRQDEYSKDGAGKRPLAWRVPVIASPAGGTGVVRALVRGKATLEVPGCDPVIVNAGQSGYYRTLYAPAEFGRIAARFAAVPAIDQLGLIADAWALGLAGLQPVTDVLDLAAATPADADPQVWRRVALVMRNIDDYYRRDGDAARQAAFRRYADGLLAPVFARTGWTARPGEPTEVAILRNDLVAILGGLGDAAVIAEARRRYASQAVPAELRKSILGVVARHADAKTWDELHAAALAEKTPLVRDQLYILLAGAEDPTLARRALDLALTSEPGETTSADMIAEVAWLNPDLAFDFATANLAAVMDKVDKPSQTRYLPQLASRSLDPAMTGKVRAWAEQNLPASARRDAETAAANVTYRAKVRAGRLPAIDAWVAAR